MRKKMIRLSDLEKHELEQAKKLLLKKGIESLPKAVQVEIYKHNPSYLKGDTSYGAIIEICNIVLMYGIKHNFKIENDE